MSACLCAYWNRDDIRSVLSFLGSAIATSLLGSLNPAFAMETEPMPSSWSLSGHRSASPQMQYPISLKPTSRLDATVGKHELQTSVSKLLDTVRTPSPTSTSEFWEVDRRLALTSVSELSDVQPTDWAFQALRSLIERYGCISGDADGLYRGEQSLSRAEFAAGMNACLNQIREQLGENAAAADVQADLAILQRLQTEFASELLALRNQIATLESQTGTLADQQFSTTTKLRGEVLFSLSGAFGDEKAVSDLDPTDTADEISNNLIFTDRLRLVFDTSFSGDDLLRLRLQVGNTPNLGTATGTSMSRLGFDSSTAREVVLNQLYYRFPVGQSAEVTVMANGTLFDVADTINPLLGFDSRGSISAFGLRSPIYREEIGATGAGVSYDVSPHVNLALVYLAGEANNPNSGLFGGSYTALGQVTLRPTPDLTVGLTYTRSRNAISIGTSSAIANDPFGGASDSIIGNSYGLQASWLVNPDVRIGGWIGLVDVTANDLQGNPDADIFYYALNVGLPDLGGEGNLAGFVFGQPPRVLQNQLGLEDPDTSLHFEGFYRFQVNKHLAITPGMFVITNPEHNGQNGAIVVGTVRTVFSF
ncbi:MAG: iron uptake porin [Cyanobacteria bacterium P01_H01_bin.15]